jgi:hypothetical protein
MRSDGSVGSRHRERQTQLAKALLRLELAADTLREGRARLLAGQGDLSAYRDLLDRYRRAHLAVQRARCTAIEYEPHQATAVSHPTERRA